jgi:hypothetical protein
MVRHTECITKTEPLLVHPCMLVAIRTVERIHVMLVLDRTPGSHRRSIGQTQYPNVPRRGRCVHFRAAYLAPHSNLLYRKELRKFNVHFAPGPIIKRTVESFGPGHACIDVGYPKTDFLFHETPIPAVVMEDCTFENDAPLVVYAPHHHAAASLTQYGFKIVEELLNMNVHIVVKLHNLMHEPDNPLRSSLATMETMACRNPRLRIARDPEPGHYYKMADVVVGDTGNSTAFESFLCKTPVVLLRGTNAEMFTRQ